MSERVQIGAAAVPEPTSTAPPAIVTRHDAGVAEPQATPSGATCVGSTPGATVQLKPPAAGSADDSTSSDEIPTHMAVDGQEIAVTAFVLGAVASVQAVGPPVGFVVVASSGFAPPRPLVDATHN